MSLAMTGLMEHPADHGRILTVNCWLTISTVNNRLHYGANLVFCKYKAVCSQ